MSAYQVQPFDLATVREKVLVPSSLGSKVATVTVVQLPAATVALHIGDGGQPIPLLIQGISFELCPAELGGIYLTNPAGAGTLILLVSYEDGVIGVGT